MGNGNFLMPWDITQSGTESSQDIPVSSGTASKLVMRVGGVLGAGTTATLTVRRNGVNTALTCTIPSGSDTCSNLVNSEAFADGDLLSILYNETGGPNTRVKYTILYQAP
jgi:hypothetical protein